MVGVEGLSILASNDFTGVEVRTDFWEWGWLTIISLVLSVVVGLFTLNAIENPRLAYFPMFALVAVAVVNGVTGATYNGSVQNNNVETLKSHYSAEFLEFPDGLPDRDSVFMEESERDFHPAEIENGSIAANGYLAELEEGQWALVVDDPEDSGNFIEFDEFVK